jgi:hypothetical protein
MPEVAIWRKHAGRAGLGYPSRLLLRNASFRIAAPIRGHQRKATCGRLSLPRHDLFAATQVTRATRVSNWLEARRPPNRRYRHPCGRVLADAGVSLPRSRRRVGRHSETSPARHHCRVLCLPDHRGTACRIENRDSPSAGRGRQWLKVTVNMPCASFVMEVSFPAQQQGLQAREQEQRRGVHHAGKSVRPPCCRSPAVTRR